jgi:hypothetical protein
MKQSIISLIMGLVPSWAFAQGVGDTARASASVGEGGVGAIWVLCNISYAGMRAQANPNTGGWRVLAFIFGLPGTIVTFFAVGAGSGRAYGIDIPGKQ